MTILVELRETERRKPGERETEASSCIGLTCLCDIRRLVRGSDGGSCRMVVLGRTILGLVVRSSDTSSNTQREGMVMSPGPFPSAWRGMQRPEKDGNHLNTQFTCLLLPPPTLPARRCRPLGSRVARRPQLLRPFGHGLKTALPQGVCSSSCST